MKTAMQELIEYLEKDYYINELTNFGKDKIKFLEKEKEQIINFAMQMQKIDCSKTGTDILLDEAEQYYNQTYNKID
jgi:hypothetical protein